MAALVRDQIALGVALLGPEDLLRLLNGTSRARAKPAARLGDAFLGAPCRCGSAGTSLAQQALLGDLLVPDLDTSFARTHVCPEFRGEAGPDAGRPRQAQRLHLRACRGELLLAEPAPTLSHVDEAFLLLAPRRGPTESGPRSFRLVNPTTAKSPTTIGADLLPVAEAAAPVRGLRPLRHHALEPQLTDARVQRGPLPSTCRPRDGPIAGTRRERSLLRSTRGSGRRSNSSNASRSKRTAWPEAPSRALHVARRREQGPLLQPLEDGPAGSSSTTISPSATNRSAGSESSARASPETPRSSPRAPVEDAGPCPVARGDARKPSYFSSKIQSGSSKDRCAIPPAWAGRLRRRRRLGALQAARTPRGARLPALQRSADLPRKPRKDGGVVVRLPDAAAHVTVAGFLDQQPFLAPSALDRTTSTFPSA